MNGYITKPVEPATLKETLAQVLGIQQQEEDKPDITPATLIPEEAEQTPSSEVLNYTALVEKLYDDEELARSIIAEMASALSQEMITIQSDIHSQNMEAVRKGAHKLRGTTGNCCAETLSMLFAHMEEAAGNGRLEMVNTLYGEVQEQARLFQARVEAVLQEG